ncbi:MAG: hypothetical protein FJ387_28705 [Verrucomicrobia bacterium]|nr:hypothetical protein [Verrucomicrobiota bacterium]
MKIIQLILARLSPAVLAVGLVTVLTAPAYARDIREDAILRVTFDQNDPTDRSAGLVSPAITANNVTYTTALPQMANSSGTAAVFNGTDSLISYGLGADNELKIETALTYHARVKHDAAAIAGGRPEQWIMGRFSGGRVSILSTSAAAAGASSLNVFGFCAVGGAWFAQANRGGLTPGVFHDVSMRFNPGISVTLTVVNAETGELVGTTVISTTQAVLTDAATPLEVGNRTTSPVPLNGVIEQVNVWNRVLGDDEIMAISTDDGFIELDYTIDLIKDLQPANNGQFLPASTAIAFTSLSPVGVNPDGIRLELNGVDRSGDLQITGTPQNRTVRFTQLQANREYVAQISVNDTQGHSKTASLRFNTYSEGLVIFEAEDYNFQSGQYINNPALSSFPGPNNYLDRLSVDGIDAHPIAAPGQTLYRIDDIVGTAYSDDRPFRPNYVEARLTDPGVEDYYVGWFGPGAWLNYTRQFPANSYRVLARLAKGGSGTFVAQLDLVTSDRRVANQTTFPIGRFLGAATGGAQTYAFTPLTDVAGNPIVLSLSGEQTLRFTLLSGADNLNANYFLFIPAPSDGLPFVTAIQPLPDAIDVPTNAPVEIKILNQQYQVVRNSIRIELNGQDLTGHAQIASGTEGVSIRYQTPGFPMESVQAVKVTFQDTATPPNPYSVQWQFTVKRVPSGNTPEIFQDAIFRVTFDGNSTADITTGNVSLATTERDIAYTTDLPPMANKTGAAALFNGTTSFISYGLGAGDELKWESALTYHCRVKLNGSAFGGSAEQWFMGRFRSVDQGNNTRVTVLSSFGGPRRFFGGVSAVGSGWLVGLMDNTAVLPDVFYDAFVRFDPGVGVYFDVFNAETGQRVGVAKANLTPVDTLMNANSPLDVGNRTMASTVPLNGAIEQMNIWNRALSDAEIAAISYGPSTKVEIRITTIALVSAATLQIQFETTHPTRPYGLVQATTLTNPTWTEVAGVTFTPAAGKVIAAQFAAPSESPRFFRIVVK